MLLSLFGLADGIGMPMQTSVNAQLGRRVGSPFTAAMINFMVGWTALLVDQFGMFRSARRPVSWKEIAGVVIMVIGATMLYLA